MDARHGAQTHTHWPISLLFVHSHNARFVWHAAPSSCQSVQSQTWSQIVGQWSEFKWKQNVINVTQQYGFEYKRRSHETTGFLIYHCYGVLLAVTQSDAQFCRPAFITVTCYTYIVNSLEYHNSAHNKIMTPASFPFFFLASLVVVAKQHICCFCGLGWDRAFNCRTIPLLRNDIFCLFSQRSYRVANRTWATCHCCFNSVDGLA